MSANFQRVCFDWSNLQAVDFRDANLQHTTFRNAENLTVEQLFSASSLYGVDHLDTEFVIKIREKYPKLFEK